MRRPLRTFPPTSTFWWSDTGRSARRSSISWRRHGVRVLAVDKDKDIFMAPRAIALDNEALRILQLAGLEDGDFDKVAIPYVRMLSPQLGEFGRINTLGHIDGHPKLVTFYQPELEAALRRRAAQYGEVHTALGVALIGFDESADAVVATLDAGEGRLCTVRARYLVGADGASSLVRQLIGQAFTGKTYAEDWLIVDAFGAKNPIDHVEFLCDHRRPTPHMTAPGGRERWEFMLRRGETRADMESEARVSELLKPWGGPAAMTIERKAVYRFHARTAKAFRKGRVFLAGDAAHITPPFVGQGLVAGLRDAANLSWKLAWVLQGRAAPSILDSYDEERRPHAKAMIDLAKFMGRLIMPRAPPSRSSPMERCVSCASRPQCAAISTIWESSPRTCSRADCSPRDARARSSPAAARCLRAGFVVPTALFV